MGLIARLFGSGKVTLRELKLALLRVERERTRRETAVKKLEARAAEVFERTKKARRSGADLEVDRLWEEVKQVRAESALERRELRALNLEAISLKRVVWGVERLERSGDRGAVRDLFRRLRSSGLEAKLQAQEIREEEYLRELDEILAPLDVPADPGREDDPEKAAFLAEIDAINAAEEMGDAEGAQELESDLKGRLAREESGG